MAVVSGTVHSVSTIERYGGSVSNLQIAEVLFTVSGTPGHPATKSSDPSAILGLEAVSVSSADVVFTITNGDYTTEFADATAVPAQERPFAVLVAFTEA
jgi:hypothetical protein